MSSSGLAPLITLKRFAAITIGHGRDDDTGDNHRAPSPAPHRGHPRLFDRTCLTVSRFRRVAGWCQKWLDVLSEQVLRGLMWLGVAERR